MYYIKQTPKSEAKTYRYGKCGKYSLFRSERRNSQRVDGSKNHRNSNPKAWSVRSHFKNNLIYDVENFIHH